MLAFLVVKLRIFALGEDDDIKFRKSKTNFEELGEIDFHDTNILTVFTMF